MPTLRDFLEKINIAADIAYEEPLAPHTTFKIGGPAEALVTPRDLDSLERLLLAARSEGLPLFVLGGGANILVGDRGIRGIVVDMGGLAGVGVVAGSEEVPRLRAEAGLSVDRLCEEALARGLAGLETFYGMPGSVGGSVFMNARCYDVEMADRLASADYLGGDGKLGRLSVVRGDWSYKRSPFQEGGRVAGGIIVAAEFELVPGQPASIEAVMREKRADREAKGHYRMPSAGSVFKNDRRIGRPSGRILDELGLRGRRLGGAMISPWHGNIFVNAGGASAAEMRRLIEFAQVEVRRSLGYDLEPEVVFVGDF